jgi:hypothetical protein
MRINPLRERWARGEVASRRWYDIASSLSVELPLKLSYDAFVLDLQHSLTDRATALTVSGRCVPRSRLRRNAALSPALRRQRGCGQGHCEKGCARVSVGYAAKWMIKAAGMYEARFFLDASDAIKII